MKTSIINTLTNYYQYTDSKSSRLDDKLMEILIYLLTISSVLIVLVIIYYIFSEAFPTFQREGLSFITGTVWNYNTGQFGILYFIVGTLAVTAVTMVMACPLSILTAIFLAEFAPARISGIMRPMIELLTGIPSVVYGLFGGLVLSDVFRTTIKPLIGSTLGFIPIFANPGGNTGSCILLASMILTIMILPTITTISEVAIRSVPRDYYEASISLGATKWETVCKVILPASMSGILTAILLGMMRAMGETMAIVMLTSNNLHMSTSILDTTYAMTSKILNEIMYWYPDDVGRSALLAIAAVLFVMEFILLIITKVIGAAIR